ncbi:MAG: sialate O-acetylesterase, partial [Planctomycetaceae bacterium]
EDQIPHPRVITLNQDNMWLPAVDPLHRENVKRDGVGPGLSFGKHLAADDETITVGLIPCAVAGSGLHRWEKGGDCYQNAIERAKEGMKFGTLKGVIWHQGEWDGRQRKKASTYGLRLGDVIRDLRSDLKMPHLPVVVGKLGTFLRLNRVPYANYVNEGLENIPQEIDYTECVHTETLRRGDLDTFNAESARELGLRYAKLMMDIHSRLAAERRADKLAKIKRENDF